MKDSPNEQFDFRRKHPRKDICYQLPLSIQHTTDALRAFLERVKASVDWATKLHEPL